MSLGHGLDAIAQGMVSLGDAGTLAQLYSNLTGNQVSTAWQAFQAAIQNLPNGVNNDDPFAGAAQPAQLAHLAPWTVALAGKVFETILADITAGKTASQLVASVRSVLATAPTSKAAGISAAACSIRSRRLQPPHKVHAQASGM
jgi:hypothetical protein